MRCLATLFFLLAVICSANSTRARPSFKAPRVQSSTGKTWPQPQSMQTAAQQFAVHPDAFHFLVNSTGQTCDILTNALDRYFRLIFYPQSYIKYILNPQSPEAQIKQKPKKSLADLRDTPILQRLNVYIQQPCDQYPSLESNESCKRRTPLDLFNHSNFLFKIHSPSTAKVVYSQQFPYGVLCVVSKHSVKLFILMII